jgi:hypothetical protein
LKLIPCEDGCVCVCLGWSRNIKGGLCQKDQDVDFFVLSPDQYDVHVPSFQQ